VCETKTKKKLAGGVGDCKSPLGFFGDLLAVGGGGSGGGSVVVVVCLPYGVVVV